MYAIITGCSCVVSTDLTVCHKQIDEKWRQQIIVQAEHEFRNFTCSLSIGDFPQTIPTTVYGKKFAYEPSGPSGRHLSAVSVAWTSNYIVGMFFTPTGWDASPSKGYTQHFLKLAATHFYTWVERGTVRVKCFPKNTTQRPRPRLEPRPLNPGTSPLTMRPPCLPQQLYMGQRKSINIALNLQQSKIQMVTLQYQPNNFSAVLTQFHKLNWIWGFNN